MSSDRFIEIPEIFPRDDFRLGAIVDALEIAGIDRRVKMIVKPPTFLNGSGHGMPEMESYAIWIRERDIAKVANVIKEVLEAEDVDSAAVELDSCPACGGTVIQDGRCRACGLQLFVEGEEDDDLLLQFVNEHAGSSQ